MLKLVHYIAILALISMTSCEKEAENITYPNFQQKIVLASFISPNDSISYVNLSSNYPIFGELNLGKTITIPNAKAYISDGSHEIQLDPSLLGFMFFHKNMHIEVGKSYTLRIEADNGLKAEATCLVPLNRNHNLHVDTVIERMTFPDGYVSSNGFVKIKFSDFPGETNYYKVACSFKEYFTVSNNNEKESHIYQDNIQFKNDIFNDLGKDGQEFETNSEKINANWTDTDSAFITFYLLNISKDFYQYQQSLNNYTDNEDPFTEISPVYSNVTDGLGIFAAYTRDSVVLRLK